MNKCVLFSGVLTIVGLSLLLNLSSCKKDKFSSDTAHALKFSVDTLSFDTVFSSKGSSTRYFKIYNPNDQKVNISQIALGGGANSFFRLNVNGRATRLLNNVVLRAKDSIWVFAEVTVDPGNVSNPFLVKDSITFSTNGNLQKVLLVAHGQDAFFHEPPVGKSSFKIDCNTIWDDSKAHVVYGAAIVDTNCTLEIKAGTKVYFHNNGSLQVKKGGSLKIKGEKERPVLFESDRLEEWYEDIPGQWLGIFFEEGSKDHEVSFLQLKNAEIGIYCAGEAIESTHSLSLNNCIIENSSKHGLYFKNSSVKCLNVLSVNCGLHELLIEGGVDYSFTHCTFGNYTNSPDPGKTGECISIRNHAQGEEGTETIGLLSCNFYNSIFYGTLQEELKFSNEGGAFNYHFFSSLVKTVGKSNYDNNYTDCVFNQDPLFNKPEEGDFLLQTNSPAINKGDNSYIQNDLSLLQQDLKQDDRGVDSAPDLGGYEYADGTP